MPRIIWVVLLLIVFLSLGAAGLSLAIIGLVELDMLIIIRGIVCLGLAWIPFRIFRRTAVKLIKDVI